MIGFSLVEKIVRWVEPVFAVAGYPVVGVAVLLERSIFIGLIVPGDVILALGGVYASQQKMSLPAVMVIGVAAAVAGESIGFWLGRRFGARLVRRIPFFGGWLSQRLRAAEDHYRKRGSGMTVALGRYATAAGAFIPFSAGVGRMPYRRFLLFDVPAIVVWAVGITLFGYLAGENLDLIDKVLSRFGYIVLGVLAGYVIGRFLWKKVREPRDAGSGPGGP